jgi:farnesyl-diphosphate farnesyltransferase
MSAYLSLRAIDEIEDHPRLDKATKTKLLLALGASPRPVEPGEVYSLPPGFAAYRNDLPKVTNHLGDWLALAPEVVAPLIGSAISAMARRMAYWVERDWRIRTREDLDSYTFGVAGAVGVLLSDLWAWHDGTTTLRQDAIRFGQGLQAVNILRNRRDDLARGVDFFPDGWSEQDLKKYARLNLAQADVYVGALPPGPVRKFCRGPLALAYATLAALDRGEPKLSRTVVLELIERAHADDNGAAAGNHVGSTTSIPARQQTAASDEGIVRAKEEVVLVNENDEVIGVEEKIKTHLRGALHRAFSIFILNSGGELLLQKRTSTKYHSKDLWSNTCCGHQRLGESTEAASRRRLREEMGFDCELREIFNFVYRAELDGGLFEHEYDHVLFGTFDGNPTPNQDEVADWRWMDLATLRLDIGENPERYTYWFRIVLERFCGEVQPVAH